MRLDQTFEALQREHWRERRERDRIVAAQQEAAAEVDAFVAQRGVELDKAVWALP